MSIIVPNTATVEFKHFHVACGIGAGAEGMNKGTAKVAGLRGVMRCIGGVDVDPLAIEDFTRRTGVQGTVLDLFSRDQYVAFHGRQPPDDWREATAQDFRRAAHGERPDIVFTSMPCKGFSGLLSESLSRTAKYQALNGLAVRGIWLCMEAWADNPPGLLIFENVPRIATRGRPLIDQIKAVLHSYGYAVKETEHDCGRIARKGMAQSRKRWLMIARHMAKVPNFVYEPPQNRLRGVGEILDKLPLPGDQLAGPMHRMPSLQWKTWVRLPTSFADSLIDRNATVDQARASAFAEMERRSGGDIRTEQPRVEWQGSHDDPSIRAARMGEAMYARLNPQHQLSQEARQYAYATPAEMARELLTLRGISITGMSPAAIITRALHSTSDFSVIVGDTINRTLRQAYQAAPSGLKRIGRQTTASDFRTKTAVMLGEAPVLERLDETGEIKSGTMAEAKESYKVETFAKKIGISRQVLVNDDLGAFADLARRFGQAAVETEARLLVSLLEANSGNGPSMGDGNPLFHASHANKAGTGAAIADASLTEARLAIRTQKGLSGAVISATPKFLIVPPSLETLAEKWIASINPAMADDVNPHAGKLSLVVEPRLTSATRWYVAADPAEIDGLEFAYLAGENGPQVESKSGWDVDGVEVRVMLDFGAGFVDWRAWFMNPGA